MVPAKEGVMVVEKKRPELQLRPLRVSAWMPNFLRSATTSSAD
jgi:hypothetical protein